MMEGVRILAENIIMSTQYNFAWNGFTIFLYILAIYDVVITIIFVIDEDRTAFASIALAICLILGGTGIANYVGKEEIYDYTEYKVIVDDTVNMNEFMKKYEILDQDGEIYIVRERIENDT